MAIIAIMAFWVFLVIIGVLIVGRIIYMKLFNKGTITIRRYTVGHTPPGGYTAQSRPHPNNGNQSYGPNNSEYTTVIDADDPDQEYKIPKIK